MSGGSHTGSVLREVQQSLAGAQDRQIEQVVAIVDALPERGAADRLIAPLRPRLAQLRPARPLRFARLLFLPLDPLIVPAPKWRPDNLTIPRTVLEPLAGSVRDAMGDEARAIVDRAIAGRTTRDTETVRKVGNMLWPTAGRLLFAAPTARTWSATGLPTAEHAPLARGIGAVLAQAIAMRELADSVRDASAPSEKALEALLRSAAINGPQTISRLMMLVLDSMPHAAAVLRRAAGAAGLADAVGREASDSAADLLLDRLGSEDGTGSLGSRDLGEAGEAVRRVAAFLDGMESDRAGPERRQRLAHIRKRVDASCRARFASALSSDLVNPLQAADAATTSEQVTALEGTARNLRRLEAAARRIGGAESYDALLRRVVQDIKGRNTAAGLRLADRVRMVEILTGPDDALALLAAEQG